MSVYPKVATVAVSLPQSYISSQVGVDMFGSGSPFLSYWTLQGQRNESFRNRGFRTDMPRTRVNRWHTWSFSQATMQVQAVGTNGAPKTHTLQTGLRCVHDVFWQGNILWACFQMVRVFCSVVLALGAEELVASTTGQSVSVRRKLSFVLSSFVQLFELHGQRVTHVCLKGNLRIRRV